MEGLSLDHCDFLKVDVEGYELEVLEGSKNILSNTSMVVVAAYHKVAVASEEDAIKTFLRSKGFKTVFSRSSYVYARA